jgi:hypothetical protein
MLFWLEKVDAQTKVSSLLQARTDISLPWWLSSEGGGYVLRDILRKNDRYKTWKKEVREGPKIEENSAF